MRKACVPPFLAVSERLTELRLQMGPRWAHVRAGQQGLRHLVLGVRRLGSCTLPAGRGEGGHRCF